MKRHRCVKKCSCRQQDGETILGYSYTALRYSRVLVLIKGVRIDSNLQAMRMEKKWIVTKNK
jgi:hypothetical protein